MVEAGSWCGPDNLFPSGASWVRAFLSKAIVLYLFDHMRMAEKLLQKHVTRWYATADKAHDTKTKRRNSQTE